MRATVWFNREYGWRLAGVGALMVAMTMWALYDGLVAYPGQNSRYAVVRPELVAMELTAGELVKPQGGGDSVYEQAFARHGLRAPKDALSKLKTLNEQVQAQQVPEGQAEAFRTRVVAATRQLLEQPVKSVHDINSQFVMAAVALAAALAAFAVLLRRARRSFSADENGLHGFAPGVIPYAEIVHVDWTRWQEKRIVVFALANGSRLTLDGWHYAGVEELVQCALEFKPELRPQPETDGA